MTDDQPDLDPELAARLRASSEQRIATQIQAARQQAAGKRAGRAAFTQNRAAGLSARHSAKAARMGLINHHTEKTMNTKATARAIDAKTVFLAAGHIPKGTQCAGCERNVQASPDMGTVGMKVADPAVGDGWLCTRCRDEITPGLEALVGGLQLLLVGYQSMHLAGMNGDLITDAARAVGEFTEALVKQVAANADHGLDHDDPLSSCGITVN